jgi:hypothetical protein
MFLDPQPTQPQSSHSSPFASTQMSAERPGSQHWKIKRKPLHERTPSQNNQPGKRSPKQGKSVDVEPPPAEASKPTVRLVTQSPPSTSHSAHGKTLSLSESAFDSSEFEEVHTAEEIRVHRYDRVSSRLSRASAAKPGLPALSVSESPKPANELPKLEFPPSITLQPNPWTHVSPKSEWHRRSVSSGNYSTSSTLKEGDISINNSSAPSKRVRLSSGTTLRDTPTPIEPDAHIATDEQEDRGPAHALRTLQEVSPARTTVRAVPPSVKSSPSDDQLTSGQSETPLPPDHTGLSTSDSDCAPDITRKSSRRKPSGTSVPAPLTIRKAGSPGVVSSSSASLPGPHAPRQQRSEESFAQSEASYPEPSSPIVVIFDSDPARPRSRSQPLRFTPSIESIQSRLQYPTIIRPQTERSLAASSSWASLQPKSSNDSLHSLHVPKKRPRHRPASLALGANSTRASGSRMYSDEDYDTLPYPRQQFSSHLSTIASESDRQSRTTSQHLSHFSLGSGVLTGDDASSIPLSGSWAKHKRSESAPIESAESIPRHPSSEEETGDMSITMYREESAKPQPLFKKRSGSVPDTGRKFDGPLPPVPPIPKSRDSDENFDTVSDLPPQSPALRPKRSGYSLRRRSNSTPSRSNSHSRHLSGVSYVDSDRGSHASSLFPTWAKHFYGGTAHLLSASKISLSSHNNSQRRQQRPGHARNDSQWTERSITSRLGTGYDELESGNSPTSSHFLPSIFRTRTRAHTNGEGPSKLRRSKRSRPSGEDDSRPDSMAIFNAPLPQSRNGETLLSGQPKWGELKDNSEPEAGPSRPAVGHRPLPRKYSKQKQWDEMEFPRPMTKDRLSDFTIPHLAPTRRTSNRLSAWRPPSFVESLDTLVRSRCNRQILLFCLGFICPLLWMLAAVLPLPKKPSAQQDLEKSVGGSEESIKMAMMKHEAGEAERIWREEKQWMKARWWRTLNRIMSVIGVLVIAAVVSISSVLVSLGFLRANEESGCHSRCGDTAFE